MIALVVWSEEKAYDAFLDASAVAREWEECRWAWHVRTVPFRSNGTFLGVAPFGALAGSAREASVDGPIGVITLGRTPWRKMRAFVRATPPTKTFLKTDGLITAVSAGIPARDIFTFSLWESEARMQSFAYGYEPGDHRETLRRSETDGILREQLSARLEPRRIEGSWDPADTPNAEALVQLADTLSQ